MMIRSNKMGCTLDLPIYLSKTSWDTAMAQACWKFKELPWWRSRGIQSSLHSFLLVQTQFGTCSSPNPNSLLRICPFHRANMAFHTNSTVLFSNPQTSTPAMTSSISPPSSNSSAASRICTSRSGASISILISSSCLCFWYFLKSSAPHTLIPSAS